MAWNQQKFDSNIIHFVQCLIKMCLWGRECKGIELKICTNKSWDWSLTSHCPEDTEGVTSGQHAWSRSQGQDFIKKNIRIPAGWVYNQWSAIWIPKAPPNFSFRVVTFLKVNENVWASSTYLCLLNVKHQTKS